MRRFAFRLERVARVREVERDRARGEWAAARTHEEAVVRRLEAVRDAARAEAIGLVPGQRTDLRTAAFRAGLRADAVHVASEDLRQARAVTEATGQVLRDAARRVDALDRLRATQREEWQDEARRDEARVLDDIVTTRAARTTGAGA